jgi:hypothetical protein
MKDRTRGLTTLAVGLLAILSPRRAATEDITLPRGTAVDVLVEDALSSRTAKVGDEFRAVLMRALWIDGQRVFPRGTVVEGRVDVVKSRATGAGSGFVGVKFVRIELPGPQAGKVTATLSEFGSKRERVDVVLIGRIVPLDLEADVQVGDEPAAEPHRFQTTQKDVEVAAGTRVSLELGEPLVVRSAPSDAGVGSQPARIHVLPETVAAAQRSLRKQGRYQGPIDGALSALTRRAIIQFQLERRQLATGDLDDETLRLLGVGSRPDEQ